MHSLGTSLGKESPWQKRKKGAGSPVLKARDANKYTPAKGVVMQALVVTGGGWGKQPA